MINWVLKGKPARNALEEWVQPGHLTRWATRKPPKKKPWAKGDRIYFWASSPQAQLVGVGEIERLDEELSETGSTRFWVRALSGYNAHGPTLAELRADPLFADASFLKAGAAGTVFPISDEQAAELLVMLGLEGWPERTIDAEPDFLGKMKALLGKPQRTSQSQEPRRPPNTSRERLKRVENELEAKGTFDAANDHDARESILRAIVIRRGKLAFREALLQAYEGRCAITQCDAPDALEAAHIQPYRGEHTNHVQNGLLLRADIHTLFDRGLVGIDASTWTVWIHPQLQNTTYESLQGTKVTLPRSLHSRPSTEALRLHQSEQNS